jgi:hypothetical protein
MWRIYGGGPLWNAVRIGVVVGPLFGLLQYAGGESSASRSILGGAFFAALLGPFLAYRSWRSWPGGEDLNRRDRATVLRVVRRGEAMNRRELVPAVLDYVAVARREWDKQHRDQWVLWALAVGTLIFAVAETNTGSEQHVVVLWALVGLWAGILVLAPRQRGRALRHASRAEVAARQLLEQSTSE